MSPSGENADDGGGLVCLGAGGTWGKSLYLPLNFAMNPKLLKENKRHLSKSVPGTWKALS